MCVLYMLDRLTLRCSTMYLQVFWKCYEYGDDLIQIFEFIDDQRAKSVRGKERCFRGNILLGLGNVSGHFKAEVRKSREFGRILPWIL